MERKKFIRENVAAWLVENQSYEGLNKSAADRIARLFIECIQDALSKGYAVELRGLGTFTVKDLPAEIKTVPINSRFTAAKKKTVNVKARKTVSFRPAAGLKGLINKK